MAKRKIKVTEKQLIAFIKKFGKLLMGLGLTNQQALNVMQGLSVELTIELGKFVKIEWK